MVDNAKLIKYKEKFDMLDKSKIGLMDGEKIKHCVDQESFNGKMYVPEWAITNMGRGFSLFRNDWLVPQATGRRNYWHFCGSKQPAVHELVVCYFKDESDKIAVEEFGEEKIEVHHEIPIMIPDNLKIGTVENRSERIKHCMECNRKSNVFYQKKEHNQGKDRLITKGCETEEEKQGGEVWSQDLKSVRNIFANSGKLDGNSNGARVVYSRIENGGLIESIHMVGNFKGSLRDEDTVMFEGYKINGGLENKNFIEENRDKILEKIKTYPPKSKRFLRGECIEGRCIYYALG